MSKNNNCNNHSHGGSSKPPNRTARPAAAHSGGGSTAVTYQDKSLTCRACQGDFEYSAYHQEYVASKKFQDPKQCPACDKCAVISPDASQMAAALVYGPRSTTQAVLERWSRSHPQAAKDGLTHVVQIRLGIIESFFAGAGTFAVQSGDVYIAEGGRIEELRLVEPSSYYIQSMVIFSGMPVFQVILRRLAREHPDWYILGVKYGAGDIQPFITETACCATCGKGRRGEEGERCLCPSFVCESGDVNTLRGIQEELQMTLTDARKGVLAIKGPFGTGILKERGVNILVNGFKVATKKYFIAEIPLHGGLGTDYTMQAVEAKVENIPTDSAAERGDISAGVSEESSRANVTSHIPI